MNNIINKINKRFEAKEARKENNSIVKRVYGSDIEIIDKLKSNDSQVIDLSSAYNIVSTVAKLGYVAGSKISLIISLTCVCEALKDPDLNKQFLMEGSEDVVDLHKLSLVFPNIGKAEVKGPEGYESVFTEEEYRVVTDVLGRTQTILLACKKKIAEFAKRIEAISFLSLADLIKIGRDLEIVATVMSELEIDAAKDENKRKGMIDITDFMNEYMKQSSRNFSLLNNFDKIKENKKSENSETVEELTQTMVSGRTLFEYEEVLKEVQEERQAALDAGEEPNFEEWQIPDIALARCVVKDPLYTLNEELLEVTNGQMKKLGSHFMASDMDLFKGFDIRPERDEEANKYKNESVDDSIIFIKKLAITIYDIINNIFKYKNFMPMSKVEDVATVGRNIIYTAAEDRGISPEDAFFLSVDAAWLKVDSKGKLSPRGYFRYKACEEVFPNELKCHFNQEAMNSQVDIEVPEELFEVEDLFVENRIFNFENGTCEIQGLDGEYYSLLNNNDEYFSGKVLVKIDEEGYIYFFEEFNAYDFERVDFFVLDSIADMRKEANKIAPDQLQELIDLQDKNRYAFSNIYNKSKITDLKAYAKDAELLKFANDIEPAMAMFNNVVKFPVSMANAFSLIPTKDKKHIYIKDLNSKVAKMAGSLLGVRLSKKLSECEEIQIEATPVGALIVVK